MLRKLLIAILISLASLCVLTAVVARLPPYRAADGTKWDRNWTSVGALVGVEPVEGWTLSYANEEAAMWIAGAGTEMDRDGDGVADAKIHMSLCGEITTELAEKWTLDGISTFTDPDIYDVERIFSASFNGQEFALVVYECRPGDHPYGREISAFGTFGKHSINVGIECQEAFESDALTTLTSFLEKCHYKYKGLPLKDAKFEADS